jgi:hypothetical protein
MLDRLKEASDEIERDKLRGVRAYNKKVNKKLFQVKDLVWKTFCLSGLKVTSSKSGQREGPYRMEKVIPKNSYMIQSVQGTSLLTVLNGKYLKMYCPNVWQDT